MNLLVSIIIPVYNCEKYISECIESIINQTYDAIEIILINDGSTDNSKTYLDKYTKLYPDIIRVINKENEGQSKARNLGINISRGEYILFVDADDYISRHTVGDCIKAAIEMDVEAVYFRGAHFSSNIHHPMYYGLIPERESSYIYSDDEYLSHITNAYLVFIKKEILLKNGIFFEDTLFEDWLWCIKLLTHIKKAYWLNSSLYYYRTNPESCTNDTSLYAKHLDIFEVINKVQKTLEQSNLWIHHSKIQTYLAATHSYNLYISRLYVRSKKQNHVFESKLHSYFDQFSPSYRLWLWSLLGRPNLLFYIIKDRKYQIFAYKSAHELGLFNNISRLNANFKTLRDLLKSPILYPNV